MKIVASIGQGDMTYKQAQKIYGIQGRSTVLVWLRKHGKLDWAQPVRISMPKSPRASESPAQTIKRLEKELEDERLRNLLLNEVVDILDAEYGGLAKKACCQGARCLQAKGKVSLSRACSLIGVSRQAVYKREKRQHQRDCELAPVKQMVRDVRRFMPRLGGRKLYFLPKPKPKLVEGGIKLGRDGFFDYLRKHGLLVPAKRNYIKTTDSKHWMKKYPNLLKDRTVERPEEVFVSDITYIESEEGVHYLSLVTDACSRVIMGHELSWTMESYRLCTSLKASC